MDGLSGPFLLWQPLVLWAEFWVWNQGPHSGNRQRTSSFEKETGCSWSSPSEDKREGICNLPASTKGVFCPTGHIGHRRSWRAHTVSHPPLCPQLQSSTEKVFIHLCWLVDWINEHMIPLKDNADQHPTNTYTPLWTNWKSLSLGGGKGINSCWNFSGGSNVRADWEQLPWGVASQSAAQWSPGALVDGLDSSLAPDSRNQINLRNAGHKVRWFAVPALETDRLGLGYWPCQ